MKNQIIHVIEIFDEDDIKGYFKIDENLLEYSIEAYNSKEIFMLQCPKGNGILFSSGTIIEYKNNNIFHNSSTNKGSSGSPIILRYSDNSIIRLHSGASKSNIFNRGINIIAIINNIKNCIIAEIEIKEKDVKKNSNY